MENVQSTVNGTANGIVTSENLQVEIDKLHAQANETLINHHRILGAIAALKSLKGKLETIPAEE